MHPFHGDARTVRRVDVFPAQRKPFWPIFQVNDKKEKKFISFLQRPELYWVHPVQMGPELKWRTQPCTGVGQDCWLSHAEVGSLIQGWIWVKNDADGKTGLLTLTFGSLLQCSSLLDPAIVLTGKTLIVRREKDTSRSAMIVRIGDDKTRKLVSSPPPPLVDQLVRLWGAPPRTVKENELAKTLRDLKSLRDAERSDRS